MIPTVQFVNPVEQTMIYIEELNFHDINFHLIYNLRLCPSLLVCKGKIEEKNIILYQLAADQGLVKGAKLCLNSYFFWLAGEVSWLAQKYSLNVENKSKDF